MSKHIEICNEVAREVEGAIQLHHPMNSTHEGYAVILEELDELWKEIKVNTHNCNSLIAEQNILMRKEAIQVAAMAIRFIMDVCDQERPI